MNSEKRLMIKADEPPLYEDDDYRFDQAQARLDQIEGKLGDDLESDHILYKSLEAILLGKEPEELKEGMVVCLLEKFFLRHKPGPFN